MVRWASWSRSPNGHLLPVRRPRRSPPSTPSATARWGTRPTTVEGSGPIFLSEAESPPPTRRGHMEHGRVRSRLRAIIPIVAALILVAGAAQAAPRSSGWSIQPSPNPPGSQGTALSAVSCDPSGSCTAVGQYGTGGPTLTLAERWNGSTWTIQPTPNPAGANALLTGISCPGRYSCTAVGYSVSSVVRPLVERWNGVAWRIQSAPIPPQSFWAIVQTVSCTARTACIAVGGVIGNGVDAQERPLAEQWDGTAWTIEPTPN